MCHAGVLGCGILAGWLAASVSAAEPVRPNVVIILTDDQGWGDLSVHGNTNLNTPHIDSLARSGALFERFYVCPVCSPTRAEFLTGRYHPRGGVWNVTTGGERLDLDERTVADIFRAAGYATGAFGKWHNGTQYPYHPLGRGFDEYYGFTSGHWGDYFSPPLDHNGEIVRGSGFLPDDLTDHALAFIEQHRAQPFFCYLPLNTPHSPMQVTDRYWDKFRTAEIGLRATNSKDEDLAMTRAALAMCENIDDNVGRVLAKLDEHQLSDRTIVVYFSDNGPNSARWNDGMKGRKGSTDEGGVRSPLLMRYPARIAAGTRVTRIAAAIDLLPTLTELAGLRWSPDHEHQLDGRSLVPLLDERTQVKDWPDRRIFSHWNGKVSVRTQQYRLDASGQLFDMVSDPGQTRNVAPEQPKIAEKLTLAVRDWKAELLRDLQRDDRPFPVGHDQQSVTQLPARDGVPHGKVRRSAKAPNCSYFENWSSVDDRITWDVEVLTAGSYEVVAYYACPEVDLGATFEVQFAGQVLKARVTQPHDPPARGHENDRVPRVGESLVKDFRPWSLGVIDLPAQSGLLSLQATEIPGQQVLELRGLVLRRR